MSKLLYITANPKNRSNSYSLQAGEWFIRTYAEIHPLDHVIRLDLYRQLPPVIDEDVLAAREQLQQGDPFRDLNAQQQQKLFAIHQVAEQFVQADKYVIVSPVWNWGIPPVLKTYFDAVLIPDKTIKWTATGATGLLENKKALHIQSGGLFHAGGEYEERDDFSHRYVKHLLTQMGVIDVSFLGLDGTWADPDAVEDRMSLFMEKISRMAINF